MRSPRWLLPLLIVLFFGSGACALILSVFPHTTLWAGGGLMLGSMRPFSISRLAYDVRRKTFEQFPWDLATLKRIYTAHPEAAKAFAGEGPILSDDRPVIEYFCRCRETPRPAATRDRSARSKRS